MSSPLLRVPPAPLLLVLTAAQPPPAGATVVATTVEDCVINELDTTCSPRSVLAVDVSFGLPQSIEVVVGEGPATGEEVHLEISKTQPRLVSSLSYLHSVIYRAMPEPPHVSELTWDGFEILPYRETYAITVAVTLGTEIHVLEVSPQRPVALLKENSGYAGDLYLRAELLDDAGSVESALDLENQVLYVPAAPPTHPYVQNWPDNMMLVPREEVTRNATDCNRVGSASLFLTHSAARLGSHGPRPRADQLAIACLGNQLFDKQQADLARLVVDANAEAAWLVRHQRAFSRAMDFQPSRDRTLEQVVPHLRHSRILVTIDQGDVTTATAESDGGIVFAHAQPFQAASRDGELIVGITNMGPREASYVVTVVDCTIGVEGSMPAQARTLPPIPFRVEKLFFDLRLRQLPDPPPATGGEQCTVELRSATGRLHQRQTVSFTSTAHPRVMSWEVTP